MRNSLLMLMPYFGRWPEWIELFVETCKANATVEWLFVTDCGEPENRAENVRFVHTSFAQYKARVSGRLGITFDPPDPYKLCDLRPFLGEIHQDEIGGSAFFGYGDIDVFYGDIRRFYTDELLEACDVLSTHPERLSGHFAVLRNTAEIRGAYSSIPGWQRLLEESGCVGLDEGAFSRLFLKRTGEHGLRTCFIERHSTVLSARGWHDGTVNYPDEWYWRNGHLTNDKDGAREFLYLHCMRWQSARWINDPPLPGEAAWVGQVPIVRVDWRRAAAEGFSISRCGILPIEQPGSSR
jgi:hypothetical protein